VIIVTVPRSNGKILAKIDFEVVQGQNSCRQLVVFAVSPKANP